MPFIIAGIVVAVIILCLRVVPQATEFVIERLGKYQKTLQTSTSKIIRR